jgi:hypothetical protein
MINSYMVLGAAIIIVLLLKYYLVNKSYENKLGYYIEPKQLAQEIVEKTIKTEGKQTLKTKFCYENLRDVISTNLVFLRIPDKRNDVILQKLRNICLCLEILQNKDVVELNEQNNLHKIQEVIKGEEKYLEKLRMDSPTPSIQESGINRYLTYLDTFAALKL